MKFNQKSFRALLLCAAVFLLCVGFARGESLVKYRENVLAAVAVLEDLQIDYTGEIDTGNTTEALREVRNLVPSPQKIELPDGGSLEADNNWLESNLREIERTEAGKRLPLIVQTEERLGAIAERLTELENAQAAALRSKNEDKQKLDEILRRAEYQKPVEDKDKSVLERWAEAFAEWWRSLFQSSVPQQSERPNFNPSAIGAVLRYLVIGLAVALIAFLVWRFIVPMFAGNRRRKVNRRKEPRVILGETLAPYETADDLISQAERLAQSGDLRAAIRKGYIAVLAELSDRKVLGLASHKTNRDYLRDVRRREELYQPMSEMTNTFERHWYGDVPAAEEDWQDFRLKYSEAVKRS
jgi:hypothetical protein